VSLPKDSTGEVLFLIHFCSTKAHRGIFGSEVFRIDREWAKIGATQRLGVAIALDAARHLLDAYARNIAPLDMPALVLLDRPDRLCDEQTFPNWAKLMDLLLPRTQFLVTLEQRSCRRLPATILAGTLRVPAPSGRPHKPRARLPAGAVLLVDLDGRLPNLALMKLSRCFKDQGRKVVLARHEAPVARVERVFASGVFSTSCTLTRLAKLQKTFGDSLTAGGSGIDIKLRLPAAVEILPADYDLYPELGDRALGFLTRGCPFRCRFCLVPAKEGGVRQVSDLDDLITRRRRKLILLDDTIFKYNHREKRSHYLASQGKIPFFADNLRFCIGPAHAFSGEALFHP